MTVGLLLLMAQVTSAPPAPSEKPAENRRTELNLLGASDTASGESRRNENVQFNLIDNNALKELNVRLGTTATIVEEFRADRGYFGAEFGNVPASPIHLGPQKRSAFHGGAHWTHGNSVFNARSFFQVGAVKPANENEAGVRFGAGLPSDMYLGLDGGKRRMRGNVNGNILVPLAGERTPLTTDPARRAIVERILSAYPAELPNRTDIDPRALNTNALQEIDDDNTTGRLDKSFHDRDRLFARYGYTTQTVDAFQLLKGQNPDTTTRAHTARLTWSRVWSAATLGNVSAGFDRVQSRLVPEPNAFGPSVDVTGTLEKLGPGSYIPIFRTTNRFRYSADLLQRRGGHTWTAGAEIGRRQINGRETSSHRGNLYFRDDFGRSAMMNLLLGAPTRFTGAVGNTHRGFRLWDAQFFAGDEWRVGGALTVHTGVRYELATRPVEVNRLNEIPYDCDCNNVAPRIGLAWRLPGPGGVVRANFGIHYGEIFPVSFQQVRYNPPLTRKFEVAAPELGSVLGNLEIQPDPGARSTLLSVSPELVAPYSQQYNFSWEPMTGARWKAQLGYVGSRSPKLFYLWYANRARPVDGVPRTTSTVNDRRPDPNFFDVRRLVNASRGYFDAARASLIVPRWRGLSLDASYWFSKAIDLGAGYTNTGSGEDGKQGQSQTEFEIHREVKGPSLFDQAHAFLARVSWLTPSPAARWGRAGRWFGRWDLNFVVLAKTGTPFSVVSGSDSPGFGNVDGDSGDRPNLVDPSVLGRCICHPDTSLRMLPRSAFAFMGPSDERGNLGTNTFRKDGATNVNASVARSWSFGGERRFTLRAESLNLLNTPQFAEPGRELTSPSFGAITNTLNDGRAFRFQGRLDF
jgi:hypothetical protein